MSQENLRAALVAAANLYPEAYPLKDWKIVTSAQATQFVFDRAMEIAAWLDAQEAGEPTTAKEVMRAAPPSSKTAPRGPAPIVWENREQQLAYARWLDAQGVRDSVRRQHDFLEETRAAVQPPSPERA